RVRRMLATVATFVILVVLWTLWSSQSSDELAWLLGAARNATPAAVAAIVLGLAGLAGAAPLWGGSRAQQGGRRMGVPARSQKAFGRPAVEVALACPALLLVGALPAWGIFQSTTVGDLVATLKWERISGAEAEALRRGYYEELDAAHRDAAVSN